jgi:hypothetical protein
LLTSYTARTYILFSEGFHAWTTSWSELPRVRWNVEGEWENVLNAPAGMQELMLIPGSGVASGI